MSRKAWHVFAAVVSSIFLHSCVCTYAHSGALLSSILSLFSFSKKDKLSLSEIMLIVDEDMNNNSAVKLHLVIFFEQELFNALRRTSSRDYFRTFRQIVRDNPDKMAIYEWEIVAKRRVSKWINILYGNNYMTPVGGVIFASYNTRGEHRATIPPAYNRLIIQLRRDGFKLKRPEGASDEQSGNVSALNVASLLHEDPRAN